MGDDADLPRRPSSGRLSISKPRTDGSLAPETSADLLATALDAEWLMWAAAKSIEQRVVLPPGLGVLPSIERVFGALGNPSDGRHFLVDPMLLDFERTGFFSHAPLGLLENSAL